MRITATILTLALLAPGVASAQEIATRILVRVLAHDAKLIGTSVGGARVVIRDAATGRLLAEGVTQGSTGSTERIMVRPRERAATVFDTRGAAGFLATVSLDRPTVVEVTAEGPLGMPQSTQRASKRLLLVPGQDVVGEGIVLEIHGFTVTIEVPGQELEEHVVGRPLPVRATVGMTWGCTFEPGGLWDSETIRVVARLVRDGAVVVEAPLSYAGEVSTFAGVLTPTQPGRFEVQVLAMDPANANFGLHRRQVVVTP